MKQLLCSSILLEGKKHWRFRLFLPDVFQQPSLFNKNVDDKKELGDA